MIKFPSKKCKQYAGINLEVSVKFISEKKNREIPPVVEFEYRQTNQLHKEGASLYAEYTTGNRGISTGDL